VTFEVDLAARVVRNSEVSSQAPLQPTSLPDPSPSSGVLVDVVVLSADARLFEAIRNSIGERNPVWRARSAEESVELLMTGRCGVLVVDLAAVSTDPAALIEQIVAQFPDVVVVVAGRREDEPLLARLVSDGHVYRFMHKPLSAKRAGMFLRASIRHHVERRDLRLPGALLPDVTQRPAQAVPPKWLFVAGGVGVFVALLSVVFGRLAHDGAQRPSAANRNPVETSSQAAVPRADPVLSRARAALAGGRYESPSGRNALDLYAAVLLASPGHAEAQAGLEDTVDEIVAMADEAAADGGVAEARRLLERLQAVAPQSDAVAALALRLEPPEPAIEPPATPLPTDPAAAPMPLALATPMAPPAPAGAPPPAAAPMPVEAPRPVVTRAPTVAVPARPLLATAPPRPAPAPTASPRRSSTVTPDPLTPRVVNADELRPLRASWRTGRPSDPGLAAAPSLPIAGYEQPTAAVQAPPAPAEPAASVPAADGTVPLPIDDFQPLSVVDPVYPPQALRNGIEGWVELAFTVTETGAVRDVEAIRAEPRGVFESAAAEALARLRFVPRTAFGRPVSQRSTVTLRFNVDG
jgi:protein TonB